MIVVVPCWRRPAHLAALLRTIERARLADEQFYAFVVDRDPAPEIQAVIESFALQRRIAAIVYQGNHGRSGPAYNILSGWAVGVGLSSMLNSHAPIGLLEEDLLVAEDVFEFWGDALEANPLAVGVSSCKNQNGGHEAYLEQYANDPEAIYLDVSYQSLAVALRISFVDQVLKYATDDYFTDQRAYVLRELPDPGLPASACSQDGLFHRVVRKHALPMVYPVVPRACHVGWYGWNRQHGIPLDAPSAWRFNSEHILTMSADHMNALADPRFRDIERCDLIRSRAALKLF